MEERHSVIGDALASPVTSLTIIALVAVWYHIWSNRIPASSYAYNYKDFKAGEHWRILTAAMAHESPLHLFFNVSSFWSVRHVEREYGSVFFLNYTLVLMIFSKVMMNWIYSLLVARAGQQRLAHVHTLGFSAVLFGWLAFAARNIEGNVRFLGLIEIPAILAPISAALVTQLLVPRSSFIGHACGMIGGHLLAFGPLQILPTTYWTFWFWVTAIVYFSFSFLQTVARQREARGSTDDEYADEEEQRPETAPQQSHATQHGVSSTMASIPWRTIPGMGPWARLARMASRFQQQLQRQRSEENSHDSDDEEHLQRMESQPLIAEPEQVVSSRGRNCA